jgi:hypothetical protein
MIEKALTYTGVALLILLAYTLAPSTGALPAIAIATVGALLLAWCIDMVERYRARGAESATPHPGERKMVASPGKSANPAAPVGTAPKRLDYEGLATLPSLLAHAVAQRLRTPGTAVESRGPVRIEPARRKD